MAGIGANTGAIAWGNPVNRMCPLNRGLVDWWLATPQRGLGFSATWRDLCGNNHGTLTNMDPATDWVASSHPGGFGSLDFDGSNDYVLNSSMFSAPSPTSCTLMAWVYKTGLVGNDNILVLQTSSSGVQSIGIATVGDKASMFSGDGGGYTVSSGSTTLATGEWYHVAAVFESATLRTLYLNAKSETTSAVSRTPGNLTYIAIGAFVATGPTDFTAGALDDLRIYSRPLSAGDIAAVYSDSLRGYPATLNRVRRPMYGESGGGGGGGVFNPYYYHLAGAGA